MQNIFFITSPTSKLSEQKGLIQEALETEIINLRKLLTFEEFFTITVHDMPWMTIKEYGCGGYTPSKDWMQIYVDTSSELWSTEKLLENIKITLVHEFNHTVRWATISYGYSLIESIISEGVATVFEKETTQTNPEWSTYSQEDIVKFLEIAKNIGKVGFEKEGDHSKYLFGKEGIPSYFGYKLGTYLVEEFRKNNPALSWNELTKKPYLEILQGSKVNL